MRSGAQSVSTFKGDCTKGKPHTGLCEQSPLAQGFSCSQPSGLPHSGSWGSQQSLSWRTPENWAHVSTQRWPQAVMAAQLTAAKSRANPMSTER